MPKDRGIAKLPDGRLEIRVRFTDPRTGKRKEARRVFEKMGVKKARQQQQQMLKELEHGGDEGIERLTLTAYVQRWLKSRKATGSRQSTMDNRVDVLEHHILPILGDLYVDAIKGADIRAWLTTSSTKVKRPTKRELAENIKPGRYSINTINGWLKVVRVVLRDAVADLDLDRDPTMRIPDLVEDPDEDDLGKALSAEELKRFLDAAGKLVRVQSQRGQNIGEGRGKRAPSITHDNYVLLLTGFFTGMRWSEESALVWTDLDEENSCIRIRRGQVRKSVAGTKTRKFRTVSVPPFVLEALRTHRQNQIRQQAPGLEKGLIFPSRDGGYRYPSSIRKTLDIVCTQAKLRRITPHWMRHTFNNLLRQAKVDHITVRATTGHSTEAMTEHYSHVELAEKQEAVAKVLALVGVG